MSVSGTSVSKTLDGNGSTSTYYPLLPEIEFTDTAEIEATADGVALVNGADFTVDLVNGVQTTIIYASGVDMVFYRVTALTQPEDFSSLETPSGTALESSLDRLTRQIQEREDEASRAMLAPVGTAGDALPQTSSRFWYRNAAGTLVEYTAAQVAAAVAAELAISAGAVAGKGFATCADDAARALLAPEVTGQPLYQLDEETWWEGTGLTAGDWQRMVYTRLENDERYLVSQGSGQSQLSVGTDYSAFPNVCYRETDRVALVSYRKATSHTTAGVGVVRVSPNLGKSWGPEVTVHSNAGDDAFIRASVVTDATGARVFASLNGAEEPDGSGVYGYSWNASADGATWGSKTTIPTAKIPTTRIASTSIFELANGDWIIGTYTTSLNQAYVHVSTDKGVTWSAEIALPGAATEVDFIQLSTGNIRCYQRIEGVNFPIMAESADNGLTWNAVSLNYSAVTQPETAVHTNTIILADGTYIQSFRNTTNHAQGAVAYLISEDGLVWEYLKEISPRRHLYSDFIEVGGICYGVYSTEATTAVANVYWTNFTDKLFPNIAESTPTPQPPQGWLAHIADIDVFLSIPAQQGAVGSDTVITNYGNTGRGFSNGIADTDTGLVSTSLLGGTVYHATMLAGEFIKQTGTRLTYLHDDSDFTVMATVRILSAREGYHFILATFGTGTSATGFALGYDNRSAANNLRFIIGEGTGTPITNHTENDATLLDRWVNIAITYDGTTYRLYVDGIAYGSAISHSGTHDTGDSELAQGWIGDLATLDDGGIDIQSLIVSPVHQDADGVIELHRLLAN